MVGLEGVRNVVSKIYIYIYIGISEDGEFLVKWEKYIYMYVFA